MNRCHLGVDGLAKQHASDYERTVPMGLSAGRQMRAKHNGPAPRFRIKPGWLVVAAVGVVAASISNLAPPDAVAHPHHAVAMAIPMAMVMARAMATAWPPTQKDASRRKLSNGSSLMSFSSLHRKLRPKP